VALVAGARRELLLRVHRHRLRREDLEDCFSQATLELIVHARRGGRFANRSHMASVIEQRFLSRIHDRRRALGGRSPMQAALEGAVSLAGEERPIDVADPRAEPERMALARHDLERLKTYAGQLTADQRLVLACQVALQMECGEFCRRYGWTSEKYRKVAQRGRARLRELMASDGCEQASQARIAARG
jgi:DNA-directed RNA polymerase specialized sigma24 family protein